MSDTGFNVGDTTYPPSITDRDWWVTWILDGKERKRPVAPWKTSHAYPVQWKSELEGEERPETDFKTAKRWTEFSLTELNMSLPEDALSDELKLGIILPYDRPPREQRVTLIDWDDVRDPETAEVHPTAAEFIEEHGGYVEVSRSGEGLHQYVIGGLRKRGKFIAPIDDEPFVPESDEKPQVEIYDGGRHVAMTGRHVEGTDTDAVDGQELIDDLITEFADAEKDAGHRRYDPESGERIETNTELGGGDHVPDPSGDEYHGPDKNDLLQHKPDGVGVEYHAVIEAFYRGAGNADGYANIQNWRLEGFAAALGEAEGRGKETVKDDLSGAYLDDTDVPQGCKHETPHRIDYGYARAGDGRLEPPSKQTLMDYGILPPEPCPPEFVYEDDGYYKLIIDNQTGEVKFKKQITNCHFRTLSRLSHRDGSREFRIEVSPFGDDSYIVNVPPTVFNDRRKFRENVLIGWSATFDGKQEDLNAIKQFIAHQDAPERNGTKRIGIHGDEFVTPDGALRVDGWSSDPDTVYTDEASQLNPLWQLTPDDGADFDDSDVAEMLRLLPQTRDSERFVPVLGWFYAAAMKPYIMDWEGEFNVLNVLGDTGSGKTTTLETLWRMFGMEGELLAADTTPFTMLTAISSTNAVPVIFDEYKPADMREYTVDNLKKYIRLSTRGGIESKGSANMETDNYRLTAPICLSGEQPLQGPAEERRSILTTFTRDVISGATQETRAFQQLIGGEFKDERFDGYDLEKHGLAYYRWLMDQDETALHNAWYESRDKVAELLSEAGITIADLDDMVMQGFQTVWFGVAMYRAFADHVGLDGREVIPDETLERSLLYLVDEGTGFEHVSHLDRLMALMSRATDAGYVEEEQHYTLVSPRDGPETELCVQLDNAFDQIRRYCRDHDVRESDILNSGDDYRPRLRDNEEQGRYVSDTSKTAHYEDLGRRRSIAFDLNAVNDEVDDFSAGAFTDDERGGGGGAGALAAKDPGRMRSFTAEVASLNAGEYSRKAQGKLKGEEGTFIGFVIPGGNDNPLAAGQGDTFHFDNVTLRTDDDDLLEAVIDDSADVQRSPSNDGSAGGAAAETDGGEAELEHEGLIPKVVTVVRAHGDGGGADHQTVVNELKDDHDTEQVDVAISTALRNGRIRESAERTYREN